MRKIRNSLLALFFLLLSPITFAQSSEDMEYCEIVSGWAKSIMGARQYGASMAELMKTTEEYEQFGSLVRALIVDAYREPRYHTERNQERAVEDFRDEVYLSCITMAMERND